MRRVKSVLSVLFEMLEELMGFGSSGQSLVEFSLILPVMILLILGGVDIGRAYYTETQIVNAAREGARMASVTPAQPCAAAAHAKAESAGLVKARDLTVTVTEWTGANGTGTASVSTLTTSGSCTNVVGANPQSVQVTVTPNFVWLTPEMNVIFPKYKLPSVTSIMVVETWAA
jgi:Flp pilus assembly protein TadG